MADAAPLCVRNRVLSPEAFKHAAQQQLSASGAVRFDSMKSSSLAIPGVVLAFLNLANKSHVGAKEFEPSV